MGSNILSYWGVSLWGEARWACYQATWGNAVWGESLWGLVWSDALFDVLAQLEKMNMGDWFFEPDVVDPGFDNTNGPLDKILSNLEK